MDRRKLLLLRLCVPLFLLLSHGLARTPDGAVSAALAPSAPSRRSLSNSRMRDINNVEAASWLSVPEGGSVESVSSLRTADRGILPSEASYSPLGNDGEHSAIGVQNDGSSNGVEQMSGRTGGDAVVEGQASSDYREGRAEQPISLLDGDSSKCVIFAAEEGNRAQ